MSRRNPYTGFRPVVGLIVFLIFGFAVWHFRSQLPVQVLTDRDNAVVDEKAEAAWESEMFKKKMNGETISNGFVRVVKLTEDTDTSTSWLSPGVYLIELVTKRDAPQTIRFTNSAGNSKEYEDNELDEANKLFKITRLLPDTKEHTEGVAEFEKAEKAARARKPR